MSDPVQEREELATLAEARRRSRRSFLIAAAGAVGLAGAWRWILGQPAIDGIPGPLRHALDFNGALSHAVFHDRALAPTFPVSSAVAGVPGLKCASG